MSTQQPLNCSRRLSRTGTTDTVLDLRCGDGISLALSEATLAETQGHALMLSLLADLENGGATLVLNSPVELMEHAGAAIELVASDGTELQAKVMVNCAGL
ncbi:MAG: hypothetical protein H7293_07595 [Candidatus Saccharibacteria bacterium]|nr:hypothetical protein [Rhodoferax sp.]